MRLQKGRVAVPVVSAQDHIIVGRCYPPGGSSGPRKLVLWRGWRMVNASGVGTGGCLSAGPMTRFSPKPESWPGNSF